jgi:DNA helicase-2/ATP-dependent DNA helicase PcrA
VGDPDQSIYSWRNADIRNILSFQEDYPQAKIVALEENYRSTQTILGAAQNLISANSQRVEKNLFTKNGVGVPIVVSEGYDEQEEAQFVVREIQQLTRNSGYKLGDIAVMYRVNAQSRALEEQCLRYGVPYQVVGGMKFYQRQEVKDLAAYLRLVANPDDDVSLMRVINVPTRGIGQRTLDELTRVARDHDVSMFAAIGMIAQARDQGQSGPFAPRSAQALINFQNMIQELVEESRAQDLIELIDSVMQRTGYKRYLDEESERGEERLENIQEFRNSARDYLQFGISEALTAFLESISLVSDVDSFEEKTDALTLITLHQAKGLEFPVVFIVGMEDGLLPHMRSLDDPAGMEEERRLAYVGVTRAKDRLYLLRAFRRGFRGGSEPTIPSRYLADIPKELIVAPGYDEVKPKPKSAASAATSSSGRRPQQQGRLGISNANLSREVADLIKSRNVRPVNRRSKTAPAGPTFSTGDKVRHEKFGDGIVTNAKAANGDVEITVAFKDGAGVKRLLLGFAKLEKIE